MSVLIHLLLIILQCTVTSRVTTFGARGQHVSMVFGGQMCGHISLLHSSGSSITAPHPHPAHAGPVIKLFGTTGINEQSPKEAYSFLVSYGSDEMLNVWEVTIQHAQSECKAANVCHLKLRLSMNMNMSPLHIGMIQTVLCLALSDNRVVGIKVPPDGRQAREHLPLASADLLTHQEEDDHTDAITSLSCCGYLQLFATSSRDGRVKVWTTSNELVSEIHLGPSLMSVCFVSSNGDLLIGLHGHICRFHTHKYLPPTMMALVRECPFQDGTEDPIPFDPELKFW